MRSSGQSNSGSTPSKVLLSRTQKPSTGVRRDIVGGVAPALLHAGADKNFTRQELRKRRQAFVPGWVTNRKNTFHQSPVLKWAGPGGAGWNKTFMVVDESKVARGTACDPRGGSSPVSFGFRDVCLITSLRALGVHVPYDRDGPLRALQDGNLILAPFQHRLTSVPWASLGAGLYILWRDGHFVAVRVAAKVTVKDGDVCTVFNSVSEVGRPDRCVWFRLSPTAPGVPPSNQPWSPTPGQVALVRQRREQAMLRRAHRQMERVVERVETPASAPREQLNALAGGMHEAMERQRWSLAAGWRSRSSAEFHPAARFER